MAAQLVLLPVGYADVPGVVGDSVSAPRLLLFVTEDWYFCSHRLPLAMAARMVGYEVTVLTRVRDHGSKIRNAGIRLIPFEIQRSGMNPLRELHTLWRLVRVYRRERPDLVHHVAMKPVLYGSLAARLAGIRHVVNALAGLGWLFTSKGTQANAIQRLLRRASRFLLARGFILVQNPDDAELISQMGIDRSRIRRIAGSGVNLDHFHPVPEPAGVPVVVLPARLLWDKGVGEFVDAARKLLAKGIKGRFVLAGEPDPANPASVSDEQLAAWVGEGAIEYAGWQDDMPNMLAQSHIVCLPSYREGLPKSLIEAAAAGRPIVSTDVPGCREVVGNGDNGLLVPARDPQALSEALGKLIADPSLRRRMGERGRLRAEAEFGLDAVIAQTLALYREALST